MFLIDLFINYEPLDLGRKPYLEYLPLYSLHNMTNDLSKTGHECRARLCPACTDVNQGQLTDNGVVEGLEPLPSVITGCILVL